VLQIKATDETSGVDGMQITNRKSSPGEWQRFKSRTSFKASSSKIFVRVRDAAGNASRWKRAR
jgi:hypothetical protein